MKFTLSIFITLFYLPMILFLGIINNVIGIVGLIILFSTLFIFRGETQIKKSDQSDSGGEGGGVQKKSQ